MGHFDFFLETVGHGDSSKYIDFIKPLSIGSVEYVIVYFAPTCRFKLSLEYKLRPLFKYTDVLLVHQS